MTSRTPTAVGKRIAQERDALDMRQHQLSQRTGIRIETLSRIENGHRYPSAEALIQLSYGLGVRVSELLGT
jgi:transcriptional regulator with XRE-family HTH domain